MNCLTLCLSITLALNSLIQQTALAEAPLPYDIEPARLQTTEQLDKLSEKIGITDDIEIIKAGEKGNPNVLMHAENHFNKKIASAYLDCSAVSAELQREESDIRQRRLQLEQQRNKNILMTNSVNFLSRGAISAPAFGYSINPKHLPTNGNILGSVANGTSTLLSLVSIAQGRGGKSQSDSGESILTPLFFDNVSRDKLTPYVWIFLNSAPLDQPDDAKNSHKKRLVRQWIKSGLAPDPSTEKGRLQLRQLLEIDTKGLNIGQLKNRETMLEGLRTTVLQMTKGLEQLGSSM